MRAVTTIVGCLIWCCITATGAAQDAPPVALPMVPVQEVSAQFRGSLLKALPDALVFDTGKNWGHQAHVPSLQCIKPIQVWRNHGDWEQLHVATWQLSRYLSLHVDDVVAPDDNCVAFTVHMTLPATVELDQQIWQSGIRLYSGRVRARSSLMAAVTIQATAVPVGKQASRPQREVRFQVARATFTCDHFITENINGLGGDFARLAGGYGR